MARQFGVDSREVVVLDTLTPSYNVGIKRHNIERAPEAGGETVESYELFEASLTDSTAIADAASESNFCIGPYRLAAE
jgi:UDP-glucose 4-epimerase